MPLTDDVTVRRRTSIRAIATAERRDQILDAAVAAFTENGFNGTSMRDIAARVGMSHTGVLHHFPEKAGILEAVLDRRVERATAGLELDPRDGTHFLQSLIALAEHDLAHPDDLRMFRIIAAESLSPAHPAHGYMQNWYRAVRHAITEALEDLRNRGHYIAQVSIEEAAAQIAGLRDGLDPQWLLEPDCIDLVA
ncbi:MAG: TetR/AcrR family transcriptional regulator, partial [Propionicimonas sp.]